MFPDELIKTYPQPIKFISNAILKNKLANCYILISKDQIDSLKISTDLAKILNCEKNRDFFSLPCGNCINCKWLQKHEHPQALFVISPDPKSKKEQIKIETIRELVANLKISSAYYRIVFFKRSDLTSLPADCGNLLLKTIEEAQPKTIFIFSNSVKNDILPTILSRGQIIYLNKVYGSISEIINLQDLNIKSEINPGNLETALENSRTAIKHLDENEINLKDYLLALAYLNYNNHKYNNQKCFYKFYKTLQNSYLRFKSFMQAKLVLQDLFLSNT